MPEPGETQDPTDKAVLKAALKAFRKRLKVIRLDNATCTSRGALTGGKVSNVVAISPPSQFPGAVWDELVRQGRLIESNGQYRLAEE